MKVVVLRPEPGASRTAERARVRGFDVLLRPLFETRPLAWEPPDPARYDALLLTSAAALRHAGPGLDALRRFPVVAVGPETARTARDAGLEVILTGDAGAATAVARARTHGLTRLLHLAGRERMPDLPGIEPVTVYTSEALPVEPGWTARLGGRTALLHSPRAAARLAELVDRDGTPRAAIRLAAISPAALAAAGGGWASGRAANRPDDEALLALVPRAD
ncbi:uroporphyrinogen-III synthase [Sphingomonas lenta]|uniref:Uroporphyrinogen-III synthase n=1 Tax=Sphingomonas lenta TaxID=1141887 RepID=A0A2A2SE50_9SPHN|nr:uroporphyrinogen-III synthase [Sphingomonas lenta]PAX07462.1 uroporphyrinogen-III synthase [Sphingomonas lenta]